MGTIIAAKGRGKIKKRLTSCLGVVNLLNVSEHHAECFLGKIMDSLAEVGVDNMIVLCRSCHPRTEYLDLATLQC